MGKDFSSLVANLNATDVRYETMEGKEYLVAPIVMMTVGVHAGTKGPLYYSAEELGRLPVVWNHKPLVVYHPMKSGATITACDPAVLTKQKVGVIMNTRFDGHKLKCDGWFEVDRLRLVDQRVLDALESRTKMEVSTGLFSDNIPEDGVWNNESYIAIVTNMLPDHLAILPDVKGACSIEDGAGLLANQREDDGDEELRGIDQIMKVMRSMVAKALRKGFKKKVETPTENELSHGDVHSQVYELLHGKMGSDWMGYVEAVFDDYVVYSDEGGLYRHDYDKDSEKGLVSLKGEAKAVKREVTYKPVLGDLVGNAAGNIGGSNMSTDRKSTVDSLIANSGWKEDSRSFLMGMTDDQFALIPVANEDPDGDEEDEDDEEDTVENEGTTMPQIPAKKKKKAVGKPAMSNYQARTPDEIIANLQNESPELAEVLAEGISSRNNERTQLIGVITANKSNSFTGPQLNEMKTHQLRSIAALAKGPSAASTAVPSYFGQGGVAPVANTSNAVVEEPLPLPSMG